MKAIKLINKFLFGLLSLSLSGNIWAMEVGEEAREGLAVNIIKKADYDKYGAQLYTDQKSPTYQNNPNDVMFELWNKDKKQTYYVRFGTDNEWNAPDTQLGNDQNNWIRVLPGNRIYSTNSITQLAYSAKEHPQNVEDVKYVFFNMDDKQYPNRDKAFVRIDSKAGNQFDTQGGAAVIGGTEIPGGGAMLKFGRFVGRKVIGKELEGALSVTKSGLDKKHAILAQQIIHLPYLYLPWKNEKFQGIRDIIEEIYIGQITNDEDIVSEAATKKMQDITVSSDQYQFAPMNGWTTLHEAAFLQNSSEPYSTAFDNIYEELINKANIDSQQADIYGKSAEYIKNLNILANIVNPYITKVQADAPINIKIKEKVAKEQEEKDKEERINKLNANLSKLQNEYVADLNSLKKPFGSDSLFAQVLEDRIITGLELEQSEDPEDDFELQIEYVTVQNEKLNKLKNIVQNLEELGFGKLLNQLESKDIKPYLEEDIERILREAFAEQDDLNDLTAGAIYDFVKKRVQNAEIKRFTEASERIKDLPRLQDAQEDTPGKRILPIEEEEFGLPYGEELEARVKQAEQESLDRIEQEKIEEARIKQEALNILEEAPEISEAEEVIEERKGDQVENVQGNNFAEIFNDTNDTIYVSLADKEGNIIPLDKATLSALNKKIVATTGFESKFRKTKSVTNVYAMNIHPYLLKNNTIVKLDPRNAFQNQTYETKQIFITKADPTQEVAGLNNTSVILVKPEVEKPINILYTGSWIGSAPKIGFNNNKDFLQGIDVLFPPYGAIGPKPFGPLNPEDTEILNITEPSLNAFTDWVNNPQASQEFIQKFAEQADKKGAKYMAYAIWFRNLSAVQYLKDNGYAQGATKNPFGKGTLLQLAETLKTDLKSILTDDQIEILDEIVTELKEPVARKFMVPTIEQE